MLVYEDINKAVWRREEVGEDDFEYIVIGKTYEGLNFDNIKPFMKQQYNAEEFYYDISLKLGMKNSKSVGGFYNGTMLDYTIDIPHEEIKSVMLYLLKHNPKWLNSSNLTNTEKEKVKELISVE